VFLAEPAATPYDLQFHLLGIRVRIAPWFWLVAVLLGWNMRELHSQQAVALTLWVAAAFLSILIHELWHALAMRYYGISSYIVLYQFGGLAIPDQYSSMMAFGARHRRNDAISEIVISAAGPAAQLALAVVLALSLRVSGIALMYRVPFLDYVIPLNQGELMASEPLALLFFFLILVSVMWALLNLLPVYPLDGGQIARNVFSLFNPHEGIRYSLILSIVTAVAISFYAFFIRDDIFLGIMFAMLGFSSFQILQAYSGHGGFRP
jgi:Zn-dependent protease